MAERRRAVIRLLGILVVALAVYVGIPLLWQHAILARVNELSRAPPPLPTTAAIPTVDPNLINAINPKVEINTEEYERIALRSQADEAMRQAQAAQDMAWQAQHPEMH
jgi:hypothetical protein